MKKWKQIPRYEGFYEVSNDGEVRSIDRYVKQHNGNLQLKKGKTLKHSVDRLGYSRVALSKENKLTSFTVHRLVAITFLTSIDGKKEINHKDCNKLNNKVENLEWCSRIENIKHAVDNNLIKYHYGDNHHANIIKSTEHSKIISMYYNDSERVSDIANKYKCSAYTIYRILKISETSKLN